MSIVSMMINKSACKYRCMSNVQNYVGKWRLQMNYYYLSLFICFFLVSLDIILLGMTKNKKIRMEGAGIFEGRGMPFRKTRQVFSKLGQGQVISKAGAGTFEGRTGAGQGQVFS